MSYRRDARQALREERAAVRQEARYERTAARQEARYERAAGRQASRDRWSSDPPSTQFATRNNSEIFPSNFRKFTGYSPDWVAITHPITGGPGKYKGDVVNGTPHGHGTAVYEDGSYEDQWVDGKGTQGKSTANSGLCYIGSHKDGVPHGQGAIYMPDGSKYVGEFVNKKASGYGVATLANGKVLDGLWSNGSFKGSRADISLQNAQHALHLASTVQHFSNFNF